MNFSVFFAAVGAGVATWLIMHGSQFAPEAVAFAVGVGLPIIRS